MVRPNAPADEADQHTRVNHDRVAKERLTREGWNYVGDHTKSRKHQDVDLGVTEDPEQVLPHGGVTARHHVEEVGGEEAVEGQ